MPGKNRNDVSYACMLNNAPRPVVHLDRVATECFASVRLVPLATCAEKILECSSTSAGSCLLMLNDQRLYAVADCRFMSNS